MGKPFNFLQAAILKAFTEALFCGQPMVITADQVVANIQSQFATIRGGKAREIGWILYVLCLVLRGPLFLLAAPHQRALWINRRLVKTRNDLMQDLARLRAIVYAGYYGHWVDDAPHAPGINPVHASLGFTLPAHRPPRPPGTPQIEPLPGRDLPDAAFLHEAPDTADAIVIGSGAGGAVAAATLAAKGYQVLIIEAGPHIPSAALSHHESDMTARLFKDGALQSTQDNDIIIFQGIAVGGSTLLNNTICLRLQQPGLTHPQARDVLADWATQGAPVDRARLVQSYAFIEQRLNVQTVDATLGVHNGTHLLEGWQRYAAQASDPQTRAAVSGWFRKNYGASNPAPGGQDARCNHCGYCNTGCAYGRKNAMPQTFLADAVAQGARILADTAVTSLEKEDRDNDRYYASGVTVQRADGTLKIITARHLVVLSAGALESSRILIRSGVDSAGRDISLNIACPVPALMPDAQSAWDEDQMTSYVDHGDFLIESHFQPPMSMAALVPGWFAAHFTRMQNYGQLVSAGVLFPADRRGSVHTGRLRFKLTETDLAVLRRGLATLCKIHFRRGALECYPALARGIALPRCSDAEVDAFFARHVVEADDVTLSSSHPHGGNAINIDAAQGIVDPQLRVHGFNNLYVADASVMPGCIRVNAQLTTMAMAHYGISQIPSLTALA